MHLTPLPSLALLAVIPALIHAQSAQTSRYWDCCKPSCGWPGKAGFHNGPVRTCAADGRTVLDANTQSACNGGPTYSCANLMPWAVSQDLAYGFVSTNLAGQSESDWCCACYALIFTSGSATGKKMIVQSVNTAPGRADNAIDLMIPGGGVGIFDGCSAQYGGLPGARFGGVSSRDECRSMPAQLRPGCEWRFDWFQNAENPNAAFERVACPRVLTDKTGCVRNDEGGFA